MRVHDFESAGVVGEKNSSGMAGSESFNLAEWICRRHRDAVTRIAIQDVKPAGINTYTYGALDYLSDKFATVLYESGIRQSDTVAIALPVYAAFVIAHLGALKCGAIITPLDGGNDNSLLQKVIQASKAKAAIVDKSLGEICTRIKSNLSDVESVFVVDDCASRGDFAGGYKSFWYEINFAEANFQVAATETTSPAYLFLNEDAEGNPTSQVASHSEIIGNVSREEASIASEADAEPWITNRWITTPNLLEDFYSLLIRGGSIEAT